jgi:hypothetical protein
VLSPLEIAKVHKFLGYPLTRGSSEPGMGWGIVNMPQTSIPDMASNLIPGAEDLVREYITRLECIEKQQQVAYMNQQVVVAGGVTMSGPTAVATLKMAYRDEQAKLSDALNVPVYCNSSYSGQPGVMTPC